MNRRTFATTRTVAAAAGSTALAADPTGPAGKPLNLIDNMDRAWDQTAYIQVGDAPGRKEPTTGEIHYKNVFQHLHQKGSTGLVGLEHGISRPGAEGEHRMIQAYREVDDFLN